MEGSDWSACGPKLDFVENDIVDSGTELLFYKKKLFCRLKWYGEALCDIQLALTRN